ncbi:MAG: TolC family protein [Sphingobacteriales bacterium]|nr:TolC family protein [Sphingobacteriales bacterium]
MINQKTTMGLKNKFSFILLLLIFPLVSNAQKDTTVVLNFSTFLQIVKLHHPLIKQADLITKSAKANTLLARGNFDPKVFYEFNNKFFESKNYYEFQNAGFKIPTWYGIELKGGIEQNQGINLNPESITPSEGLAYTQISIPLLQGLIIDERRSVLKQAKLFQIQSNYDKTIAINEILYKAGKAYWEWQLSYNNLQVHQSAVTLSKERFEAVKRTSVLGDRPAIDTVEAIIQLQDRILTLQQSQIDFRTKSLLLSNFLWLENDIPIELTNNTIPDVVNISENNFYASVSSIDSMINNHPTLKIYDLKLKQLDIEKEFKKDKLKPNLNVNYNPLFNANNFNASFQNNYKWGVSLGFPIFLRKERGDLQLTKLKIENTSFDILNKRNEIRNKINASINELNTYKNQVEIYSNNAKNYEKLWLSEKRLFDSGESSLFMINSREQSYINAQIKLNEILNKNKKTSLEIEYSYGVLNTIY